MNYVVVSSVLMERLHDKGSEDQWRIIVLKLYSELFSVFILSKLREQRWRVLDQRLSLKEDGTRRPYSRNMSRLISLCPLLSLNTINS